MTRRKPPADLKRKLPLNPANAEAKLRRLRHELDGLLADINLGMEQLSKTPKRHFVNPDDTEERP